MNEENLRKQFKAYVENSRKPKVINTDPELSVKQHLKELRNKFVFTLIGMVAIFFLAFAFSDNIIGFILDKFDLQASVLSPTDYISAQMKISGTLALLFAIPVGLVSTYKFTKPSVKAKHLKYIKKTFLFISALAILGVAFAYLFFIPYSFQFFKDVPDNININWNILSIINYIMFSTLAFAGVFQMTAIIPLITKLNIVSRNNLKKMRKPLAFTMIIVAGLITPAFDGITQLVTFVPLYFCFEAGLLLSKLNKQEETNGIIRNE